MSAGHEPFAVVEHGLRGTQRNRDDRILIR
jgi:hypothetical protein